MHFSTKELIRGRSVRSLSVVLAVLMLISTLFVGSAVNLEADAESKYDSCIFFDFAAGGQEGLQWIQNGARPAVWWWSEDSAKPQTGKFAYLDAYSFEITHDPYDGHDIATKAIYVLYIPEGQVCTHFQVLRMTKHSSWTEENVFPTSDVLTQTGNIAVQSGKIFYVNCNSDNTLETSGWYDNDLGDPTSSPVYGNTNMIAEYVGKDSTTKGNVEIYPVDATFYDYLTDYELVYGWRSQLKEEHTSRTYRNRIPYKSFNSYISDLAGTPANNWNYPLYFGNFTSHWSAYDQTQYTFGDTTYKNYSESFDNFPYGTLMDINMLGASIPAGNSTDDNGNPFTFRNSHLRSEAWTSSYTTMEGLNNFSVFVNNSEAIKSKLDNTDNNAYAGSIQGLVEDSLDGTGSPRNGKLVMKGGMTSPYFSGANDYTNTVTTQFPMRVVNATVPGTTYTYTKYEFDSMGKAGDNVDPDIAYFTYENGQATQMHYTNDRSKQIIDAYLTLGNNKAGDHRGFFPFDNTIDGNGIGRDYGFGMRLDIDFNLTEDGNIYATKSDGTYVKTNEPMEFTFEGDDDVWVFVDGKLALDLGGDHGNAKGSINFNIDRLSSTVDTGAGVLKENPTEGQSEFGSVVAQATQDLKSKIFLADDDYTTPSGSQTKQFNTKKQHTLTVFYMERGLVESNLHLGFSVSPTIPEPDNFLTVEKTLDLSGVASSVKTRVENSFVSSNTEKFDFAITGDKGSSISDTINGGVSKKYTNKLVDGEKVTIAETVTSAYKYDTKYTVTDNFVKNDSTADTGVIVNNRAAADAGENGGGSVSFDFNTSSTENDKYNDFTVSVTNVIKVGEVTIKKNVTNSESDSSVFDFDYFVKLPGETSYPSKKDGTVSVTANSYYGEKLTGLPVGSSVKFVEKMTDDQKKIYTAQKDSVEVTVGGAVEFNNTINSDTAVVNAKKLLDGAPSSVKFDFALTKVVNGEKTDDKKTAKNSDNGAVSFVLDGLMLTGTYDYMLEETSKTDGDYTCDSTRYWVTVDAASSPISVKYYTVNEKEVTSSGRTYTVLSAGNEVDPADVVFKNTSNQKFGDVTVVKSGEDGKLLENVSFALVKAVQTDDGWIPASAETPMTEVTGADGKAVFSQIPVGDYVVYETKSAEGYELLGEYVHVKVRENDNAQIDITNPKSRKMPKTGGVGVAIIILIGAALIALGIYILRPTKKEGSETARRS